MNQAGETIARLQGASKNYGDVLALDPNHAEALHNLSVLRTRSGAV